MTVQLALNTLVASPRRKTLRKISSLRLCNFYAVGGAIDRQNDGYKARY